MSRAAKKSPPPKKMSPTEFEAQGRKNSKAIQGALDTPTPKKFTPIQLTVRLLDKTVNFAKYQEIDEATGAPYEKGDKRATTCAPIYIALTHINGKRPEEITTVTLS